MKQINDYCTYELTPQEEMQSHLLTAEQLAKFQNIRTQLTIQKGNLEIDLTQPNPTTKFVQTQAWLQGQLDLISTLINANEEAVLALASQ